MLRKRLKGGEERSACEEDDADDDVDGSSAQGIEGLYTDRHMKTRRASAFACLCLHLHHCLSITRTGQGNCRHQLTREFDPNVCYHAKRRHGDTRMQRDARKNSVHVECEQHGVGVALRRNSEA